MKTKLSSKVQIIKKPKFEYIRILQIHFIQSYLSQPKHDKWATPKLQKPTGN